MKHKYCTYNALTRLLLIVLAWHLYHPLLNFVRINESDANVTETELDRSRRALCCLNSGRSDEVDYLEKGEF